jgi:holin-like protein
VKDTGKFLVDVMPVMFIPAAVGIINSWSVIQPKLLAYGVITFASTFIVMAVSGRVTQKIIRGGKKHD